MKIDATPTRTPAIEYFKSTASEDTEKVSKDSRVEPIFKKIQDLAKRQKHKAKAISEDDTWRVAAQYH